MVRAGWIKFVFLMVGILFTVLPFANVEANGVKISPARFDENINPGQTITRTIDVTNNGEAADIDIKIMYFKERDESGSPTYIEAPKDDNTNRHLYSWIEGIPSVLSFDDNEEKTITFDIVVPENARPGGYYVALFFQTKPSDSLVSRSGARMSAMVGGLLVVNINGEVVEDAELRDFTAPQDLITNENLTFVTSIENLGNTHLAPIGKIYIKDADGNNLEKLGRVAVFDPDDSSIRKIDDVNYLPFNQKEEYLVLPGQTRNFKTKWNYGELKGDFTAYGTMEIGNGEQRKEFQLDEIQFSIEDRIEGEISTDKKLFFDSPVDFVTTIKNTGSTIFVDPQARINVYNVFGAQIQEISLDIGIEEVMIEDDLSERIVKRMPPGEISVIESAYEADHFFGLYTAELEVISSKLDGESIVIGSTAYWAGSLVSFVISVVVLVLVLLILIFAVKKYKYMQGQLRNNTNQEEI